jgi:glutathione peroxidase-family protein
MINYKRIIYIIIFMISFFNTGNAKYDKIFFDFDIKDINEETFVLDKLRNKTVLLVNVAGNSAIPKWNFHKILINKQGKIEETYSSFTKPMSDKIIKKLEEIL